MKITRCSFATAVMIDGSTHMSANEKNAKTIEYNPELMIYEITGKSLGKITWVHSTNVQYSIPADEQETSTTRRARTSKET